MDIGTTLSRILEAVKHVAPIASQLGIPIVSQVAGMANMASKIAENVLNRIEQGQAVLKAEDEQVVRDALAEIQAANEELNKYIASH